MHCQFWHSSWRVSCMLTHVRVCADPISKRARPTPLVSNVGVRQAGIAPSGEGAAPCLPPPVGEKAKKYAAPRQLEDLPYRRADGKWTCTFSTGGMNKNR